ncbi:hypothetical protein ABEB36_009417 [Hypothenemus hampei]|uniref:Uncharacterized protein n=1 Tax=Hypothenemus hampei TaxID=57062 RepID=A0ABD1EG93_HYPHA
MTTDSPTNCLESSFAHRFVQEPIKLKVQDREKVFKPQEELRNKLLPGVKDGASAAERLEAANLSKAIVPAITTRSIGIGTVDTFTNIYNLSNVPQRGSIYQLYRVGLAALECQITVTSRSITTIISNEDDFAPLLRSEDMIVAAKGIV